ncbi:LADA_0H17458g1_1 [Lachancea dasiensis]|uniref:DNA polymerase n=1 Tax=Lachancea dasiensis TaxID=1072105 RepID=A0A1G4K5M9_9SACH|nr:LADA_0H17458g1_1 [Lachancea dasiensis]
MANQTLLFAGLKFLILPSCEPPRVQFVAKLIENNGGSLVQEHADGVIILVTETFVGNNGLNKLELFHSEWDYSEDLWYKVITCEEGRIYKLSWIVSCLKYGKLVDPAAFTTSLTDEHEVVVDIDSISSGADSTKRDPDNSEEETDVGSQVSLGDADSQFPLTNLQGAPESHNTDLPSTAPTRNNPNASLIQALSQLSKKYRLQGDTYRSRGYQMAVQSIEAHDKPISTEQEALALPNIGPSIGSKIQMFQEMGCLPGLDEAFEREETLDYFMGCHGVGAQTARKWVSHGADTFAEASKLFPSDFTWPVLFGWRYYEDWAVRIPREECSQHLALIQKALSDVDDTAHVVLTGSYRRGVDTCGDIDTVLYKPDCDDIQVLSDILEKLVLRLQDVGYVLCPLNLNYNLGQAFKPTIEELMTAAGLKPNSHQSAPKEVLKKFYCGGRIPHGQHTNTVATTSSAVNHRLKPEDRFMLRAEQLNKCRRVDILLSRWSQLGAVMIYFTGNDDFNKSLRVRATKRGWKLTNNGLYHAAVNGSGRDVLIESFDETRIMELLGMPWVPPIRRNISGYI